MVLDDTESMIELEGQGGRGSNTDGSVARQNQDDSALQSEEVVIPN